MGVWEAKIAQNAVAHELGHEAVIARDHDGAGTLLGADHLPHILGIEPRRQCSRAREVAKHDRQLAALSRIFRRWPRKAYGSRRLIRIAEICDRLQNSLSGSERQAELFKIDFSQFWQNIRLNLTFAKRAVILPETEAAYRSHDIH